MRTLISRGGRSRSPAMEAVVANEFLWRAA